MKAFEKADKSKKNRDIQVVGLRPPFGNGQNASVNDFINVIKEAMGGNQAFTRNVPTHQAQNFMQIMKNLYNKINQGGNLQTQTYNPAPYKQYGTQNYLSGFINQFSPTGDAV